MTQARSPIGLGDVFQAIAAIAPDDPARWGEIAAVLGFEATGELGVPQQPDAPGEAATAPPTRPRDIVLAASTPRQEGALPVLPPASLPSPGSTPPPFLVEVATLPHEAPAGAAPIEPPPLQPLWPAATTPSLLRAAVVMPQADGEPDVDALVDALARRRGLQHLPRRRAWRIARDVVLLQDLGAGMDAFLDDMEPLLQALRQVAGQHAVRDEAFLGRPLEALERAGCHRGTAVVVLSDLGLGRLATAEERDPARWFELADAVARVQARLTVLTPWDRWPAELAARLSLVTWDRGTGVAQVMHAVRQHG